MGRTAPFDCAVVRRLTNQILTAPASPGAGCALIRSSSIRATNWDKDICSRFASPLSKSQNNGSRLIEVRWPFIVNEYLTGG